MYQLFNNMCFFKYFMYTGLSIPFISLFNTIFKRLYYSYYSYSQNNKSITLNHYKLYIYIDPKNNDNYSLLKELYLNSSKIHNEKIDSYIYAVKNNIFDFQNMNEYCYDSGFDLFCPNNITINNTDKSYMLDHKIKCCMIYNDHYDFCFGYTGFYLYSRSSTPIKTPLRLANSVGIIDSGYRGNIKANFDNKLYTFETEFCEHNTFELKLGERYTQICAPDLSIMKIYIVDNLNDLGITDRGNNGFGSTGN